MITFVCVPGKYVIFLEFKVARKYYAISGKYIKQANISFNLDPVLPLEAQSAWPQRVRALAEHDLLNFNTHKDICVRAPSEPGTLF